MAWYHIVLVVIGVWFLLGVLAVWGWIAAFAGAEAGDMCETETDQLIVCPCCSSTDVVVDPDGAFLCSTCRCVTVVVDVDLSRLLAALARRNPTPKETGPC